MLYGIQGRPAEAREAYEAALRLDPDNKEAKKALEKLD
jgi:cytochrome c-type biogenesis protein CcmH/NrfG